ncbi:monovalent cation/H+ antiporter subunit A [Brackiella oedipodis]|uniref:monovalent cation/H+ antiporter subunit A n=1 Tax=Brackiella oedipodis TaxID=124225 RepID=UPI0006874FF1|nr:monovalent cation/H+ antiporter subunit A [Brackiella oedipodis]
MLLLVLVVLPFIASLFAVILPTHARNQEAWLSGLVTLIGVAIVGYLAPSIFAGKVIEFEQEWIHTLGLNFHLRMDGFSWIFAFLVTAMGGLVVIYSRYYMDPADPVPRFFAFFLVFMGSMLGLVLSGNVIQMVVFWEMTSLASFMLIAYWHHRADARRGARMAFSITAAGGLALLASMLMIGHEVGSYRLDAILNSGDKLRDSNLYLPILLTFTLGVLSKSAQFPLHFWLPNAMAAPTPVSTYLHSATLVKIGVLTIARFWPVLAGTNAWFWIFTGAGMISLLMSAYIALFQRDMKGILAYSTISHLGLITLLLGLNSPIALVAAIFHMLNHATFKASLFMATGIVDHETGTRDIKRLSGLFRVMPLTAVLAIVAAAAMAGVPLLNGFISKEMFFSATLMEQGPLSSRYTLPVLAVIAATFSVSYSYRFIKEVFFGRPPSNLPKEPHNPPIWMVVPIGILVLCCLVVGILPAYTIGPFLDLAVHTILGSHTPDYDLAVWHGFNWPLLMSVVALVAGISLVVIAQKWLRHVEPQMAFAGRLNGSEIFTALKGLVDRISNLVFRGTYSSHLQTQVFVVFAITFVVALMPLLGNYTLVAPEFSTEDIGFAILWLIGAAAALGAAYNARLNRFRCLIMVGVAGVVTILTFAWLSAPDLALTQSGVEIATLILILLGLRWLPRHVSNMSASSLKVRLKLSRDVLLSLCCGVGLSLLSYILMTKDHLETVSHFFTNNAYSLGGGHNIINVILVDFRGFDTFGEITVLAIAALSVYALLRRFRPPQSMISHLDRRKQFITKDIRLIQSGQSLPNGTMLVPNVLVRLLMPIFSLVAFFFFLRGHNLPGGGFIGGLVFAIGVIAQYMMSGIRWVESKSRITPQNWLAVGLLLAVFAGVLPWFAGQPFFTALSWNPELPIIGELHLSTVLIFDAGVFSLVVGCTTYILVSIAHQSLRFYRQQNVDPEALEEFKFQASVGVQTPARKE